MAKKKKKASKKASPKKPARGSRPVSKRKAAGGTPSGKASRAKAPAPAAAKAGPEQAAAPVTPKKPRAKRAKTSPSGRPASKPHVHEPGDATEAPRGRSRTPASGPTHNGIGDEAVRNATGKGWADWLAILDEAGAKALDHQGIVAILREQHQVGDWWAQMVTVGYEQARGMREKNQTPAGYQASMSKTIAAPVSRLYKAWADEAERAKWLGDVPVEVRVANEDKNIRLTWLKDGPEQGTSVEVGFFAKDGMRGMVQVQQNKLEDAAAVARVRAFWSVKLETLRSVLEK